MNSSKLSKGFSLIELLVTIAIVGVLAAMALGSFNEYTQRAKYMSAKQVLHNMLTDYNAVLSDYSSEDEMFESLGVTDSRSIKVVTQKTRRSDRWQAQRIKNIVLPNIELTDSEMVAGIYRIGSSSSLLLAAGHCRSHKNSVSGNGRSRSTLWSYSTSLGYIRDGTAAIFLCDE